MGDAVDDDLGRFAGDAGDGVEGLIDLLGAGDLHADDAEDFVAGAGDEAGVGDDKGRRRVDDDDVEVVLEEVEGFVEFAALEEFDGIAIEFGARAQDAEVGEQLDGPDQFGGLALEEFGEPGSEADVVHAGEVAFAEVGVDEEDVEAGLGEGDGELGGD